MFRVLFLLILCTSNLYAAEISTYGWMQSYHWDRTKEYNETHEIIGFEYKNIYIEAFNNSKNNLATAIGYINRDIYCDSYNLCYGFEVGLIKGYGEDIKPMALPVISFKGLDWGIDARFFGTQGVALRFRYIWEF